ncbi:MAG: nucleotidyltransferase domain-containing protein, partial [Elusimicrobiales bacterium]|nr:nucleotidyltransferase domain-containing protein [Elusimicrobiales bacterium]
GEAHEDSDIDVMVILDRFSVRDMDRYREILNEIGFYERSKDEIIRFSCLQNNLSAGLY